MAKGDISITEGQMSSFTTVAPVRNRTSSSASATIKAGEPVNVGIQLDNWAKILATGEPNATTTNRFLGIAEKESTETSTVDGYCNVTMVVPVITVLEAKATTVTNMDTSTEFYGIVWDAVAFDLTGSTFTIDENEGDDANDHGLLIIPIPEDELAKGRLQVMVKPLVSIFGNTFA